MGIILVNKNAEQLPIDDEKFTGVIIAEKFFTFEQLEEAAFQYLTREPEPESTVIKEPQYNTQGMHIHIHCHKGKECTQ
jgi:hypothetical protein